MFIASPTSKKDGRTSIKLVHSFRKNGKPTHKVLKVIGRSDNPTVLEQYRNEAETYIKKYQQGELTFEDIIQDKLMIDLYRCHGKACFNRGIEDVFGRSYDLLKFSSLLIENKGGFNEILKYITLTRIFDPSSKLKSCQLIKDYFNKEFSYSNVLRMMDHLSENESSIRKSLTQTLLKDKQQLDLLLFDVTTLSFESVEADDLRDFGYSKDGKFGEVQVVLAVMSDNRGMPLSYEVFPGNTGETNTFRVVIQRFIAEHAVRKICIVADRAMFSEKNFKFLEDIAHQMSIQTEYVVSCPLKKMTQELKEQIFQFKVRAKKLAVSDGSKKIYHEWTHKGRRLVVSYCDNLRKRDEHKREKLLSKLDEIAQDGQISSKKLIRNSGMKRYLSTKKTHEKWEIDFNKALADSKWDGLYGVYTNQTHAPAKIMSSYGNLWKIEELFRINKHNLSMRPIYHRLSRRIRAHFIICFLAYTTLKHAEISLKARGVSLSLDQLISELTKTQYFIIAEKWQGVNKNFYIPKALSERVKEIYELCQIPYTKRPYRIRN